MAGWQAWAVRSGVVVSLAACLSTCAGPPKEAPTTVVRLTIGARGGSLFPLGEALARAYEASLPGLRIEAHERTRSVSNVEAILRGDADLGFAYADVAYTAFVGHMEGLTQPTARLRGIAVLQLAPVHLVVRGNSGIDSVNDLRGRRVGLGQPASSSALTAGIVLKAFNVDRVSVETQAMVFDEAAVRLVNGSLDAFFVTGSYPADSVSVAARAGARVLPLSGGVIDQLRHDYPFLRRAIIPGGTYPGQPEAVETVGVDNLLVCSARLDESLVYSLTKRFFEVLPSLLPYQDSLRLVDLEQAPATPIPLHDGAARYYRERELER